MLEAPDLDLSAGAEKAFREVVETRNPALLPASAPRWVFLQWLARQSWLLHGSQHGNLNELRSAEKAYHQPDEFSNTRGVYAASDGLWAMMYALRGPQAQSQSDMGLRLRLPDGKWSGMRYFLSLAARNPAVSDTSSLQAPGFVYVLRRTGFQPSPPYLHLGLGEVQEAHWVSSGPVRPLMSVPVSPDDFPLKVRLHDAETVRARAAADPWGFPWLAPEDA